MGWPVPSKYQITTAYGKRGTHWSCNEDSNGNGVHTGVDFAAPAGTPLYATIAGDIRHRNYGPAFGGKQFAISPDDDEPFGAGEAFYAHARKRLADGTRVEVGDWVGEVGAEGNVTGPHLHYEFHPHDKGVWNCYVHADPGPTLGVASGLPHVTAHVYRSKCGYGEPTNGDASSDTVKELQETLNRISLSGGQTLAVTGKYDDDTDDEVRKWQEQICHDSPDPQGKSYLGPNQFAAMFHDAAYTRHDDGDPQIASSAPEAPSSSSGTTLGRWLKAQGFVVHDDGVPFGRESEWHGVQFLMVHHTASPTNGKPADIANYIRHGGSGTYPPLAQIMLDQKGEVWMCSQERSGQPSPGRASHAGSGSGFGVQVDSMNQVCLGIECQADGTRPLSAYPTMYERLLDLLAALSQHYQVPVANIIGHKEWSSTGKVDPLDDMVDIRTDVNALLHPVDPEEPPMTDRPETITFPLGIQYHYSGKPSGDFTFSGSYKRLDVDSWGPKKAGLTFGMIYLNSDGGGEFRSRLVRESPNDETAYQTHYPKSGDNYLATHVWFESGEAGRKLHYELASMDGETFTVTTRYAKFVTIPWDVVIAVAEVGAAYMYVVRPVLKLAAQSIGLPWPDMEEQIKRATEKRAA